MSNRGAWELTESAVAAERRLVTPTVTLLYPDGISH